MSEHVGSSAFERMFHNHSINIFSIVVVSVIAELIGDVKEYQETACYSYYDAREVEKVIPWVTFDVSKNCLHSAPLNPIL